MADHFTTMYMCYLASNNSLSDVRTHQEQTKNAGRKPELILADLAQQTASQYKQIIHQEKTTIAQLC